MIDRAEGALVGLAAGAYAIVDDARMAARLHLSLRARGRFDAVEVARGYAGLSPGACGALARTAPIGVALWRDGRARRQASLDDAALTDVDPLGRLACAAFNAAIAAAIAADRPDTASRLSAASGDLDEAARLLAGERGAERERIERARAELADDLAAARRPDPRVDAGAGALRVAFRLAFWELVHAPSWEAAVEDAAKRGGDAAIAGALAGAHRGRAAIPRARIERARGAFDLDRSPP